jgi:hypothetical protein
VSGNPAGVNGASGLEVEHEEGLSDFLGRATHLVSSKSILSRRRTKFGSATCK